MIRTVYLLIFLLCTGLISYALYLQQVEELLPCPLCIFQRMAYWLVGLTALAAFMHAPQRWGQRLYSGLIALFAFIGAIVAGRHAWLIRYPDSFECGISPEEEFLNSLPLAQWWPAMFEANGDCTDNSWQLLTLAMPDWSLFAFIGLMIMAIWLGCARLR